MPIALVSEERSRVMVLSWADVVVSWVGVGVPLLSREGLVIGVS